MGRFLINPTPVPTPTSPAPSQSTGHTPDPGTSRNGTAPAPHIEFAPTGLILFVWGTAENPVPPAKPAEALG